MKSPSLSLQSPVTRTILFAAVPAFLLSFIVYYLTAFRSITWWNSAECSLAASTLGVMHPPGCLIGTILGWLAGKLAVCGSVAFAHNLLAGLVAALTAALVGIIAARLLRQKPSTLDIRPTSRTVTALSIGGTIGALTIAFAQTVWFYAVRFTPYIFTILFTALILFAMIKWWQTTAIGNTSRAYFWLFIATLLFGLDFSVHRTNLLMAPGLIIWMLLCRPKVFVLWRTWMAAIAGLVIGLLFHMIIIPMAAAGPFLNASNPDNLARFWDYVTLQQLGGGFLLNIFPRNAPFWDVQVTDYLRAFSANFFSWRGPIPLAGLLPAIFGLVGLVALWRNYRRMTIGLIVLFLLTSAGAIVYFNIPENFFRSLFRHYMPSFVIFSVWIAYGLGSLVVWAWNLRKKYRRITALIVIGLLAALPGHQLAQNYHQIDGSNHHFAYDWAQNVFAGCDDNAIIITRGDNDTFPLWYFRYVENIRPDVTIINTPLLNTTWFVKTLKAHDPKLPITLTDDEIDALAPLPWTDTAISVTTAGTAADYGLPEDTILPNTITFHIPPSIGGSHLMIQDQILLHLIKTNNWRRPIYFMAGTGPVWVQPYTRFEGLLSRLLPYEQPPLDTEMLADRLLHTYSYRGHADDNIYIDPASKSMSMNYIAAFLHLIMAVWESGDKELAEQAKNALLENFPPHRMKPLPENFQRAYDHFTASGDT